MSKKDTSTTKQKIELFEKWMKEDHALIHFDSRADGVGVPDHLRGNPALTLKLSYNFQGETKHDETQISSYLRFSGSYHQCIIPWTAVWGMTSEKEQNQIFAESLPPELVVKFAKAKLKEIGSKIFKAKENKPDELAEPNQPVTHAKKDTTDEKPSRDRSFLKRVK
jgi:hypothetical protein